LKKLSSIKKLLTGKKISRPTRGIKTS